MELYTKQGWLNAEGILQEPEAFKFITGARGIGKTYGFLKYFLKNKIKFILMRRLQDESELQWDPVTSSLTPVCRDLGITWHTEKVSKKAKRIISDDGTEICICLALSTFSGIRGIDLTSYDYVIYDEFITEPHVRQLKMEGLALSNAYETIARNREIQGYEPLQMICLSNSLNIANDVFMQFDLVTPAEQLISTGREIYREGNKLLIVCQNSPISKKKAGSVLYTSASEEFAKMAIHNKFILNDFTYVSKKKLSEYRCIWSVGSLYVYEHKGKDEYYITFTRGETGTRYGDNYMDLQRCQRDKWKYWTMYLDGYIRFDSYKAIALFEKYFNK